MQSERLRNESFTQSQGQDGVSDKVWEKKFEEFLSEGADGEPKPDGPN